MTKKQDWNAEFYREEANLQFQSASEIINKYRFKGNESILDVGCGDGNVSVEIAKKLPDGFVLGVDVSPAMINFAKNNFFNVKNLKFQQVDITNFTSDKKFDIAFSFSTFHWVKDKIIAIKNIYDVLKPNGELIIHMVAKDESEISKTFESEKWKTRIRKESFFGETEESLIKILQQVGFKEIRVQSLREAVWFKSSNELLNHFLTWLPYATGLDEKSSFEVANDIVKAICSNQKITAPNEKIKYETLGLTAVAKKI